MLKEFDDEDRELVREIRGAVERGKLDWARYIQQLRQRLQERALKDMLLLTARVPEQIS